MEATTESQAQPTREVGLCYARGYIEARIVFVASNKILTLGPVIIPGRFLFFKVCDLLCLFIKQSYDQEFFCLRCHCYKNREQNVSFPLIGANLFMDISPRDILCRFVYIGPELFVW